MSYDDPGATAIADAPVAIDAAITEAPGCRTLDDDRCDRSGALPLGERLTTIVVILLPIVALIVAMVYAWGNGFGLVELSIFTGMYLVTGFGITIGYHRLFAHKSFEAHPALTAALGVLGSMAVEGPIIRWTAFHRCHHRHSDNEGDPHSPHGYGGGIVGVIKGFWNAHMGWILIASDAGLDRYVPDLNRNRMIKTISDLFPLWVGVGLLLPALLGGVITQSWTGAFLGFLWGGLIRISFVHHITWSVNSVCHLWGTRPYRSDDESRNNPIVGVLALGEGWHNNHHAFPTSARHGLAWWQLDPSWIVIRGLEKVGLIRKIRVPTAERMAARRLAR